MVVHLGVSRATPHDTLQPHHQAIVRIYRVLTRSYSERDVLAVGPNPFTMVGHFGPMLYPGAVKRFRLPWAN